MLSPYVRYNEKQYLHVNSKHVFVYNLLLNFLQ